jgi:hypothetical protein
MLPSERQLAKLIELAKGDQQVAEERQEDLLHLGVALLAAFTYVPLNVSSKSQVQKFKVSLHLAEKFLLPGNHEFAENWLSFLRHPTSSINVLKSLYSMCMASSNMCLYLSKNVEHLSTLSDIVTDKVESLPVVVNELIEIAIHTMSTIIIQLYDMPMSASASLT